MKNLVLILSLIFFLTSCRQTYIEVYYIEKYPVTIDDTIYSKPTHWHYQTCDNSWSCMEIPADTFHIVLNDTLYEKTYMGTYKKKEHNTKWNIKKMKQCDEKKECH